MPHRIRHAKSYPFRIPPRSFVYRGGETRPLDGVELPGEGRVPVLAAGSNQSPEQIHRKFADLGRETVVPSQRGRLHDFDVVYAAHLARYGSLPATFQHSPGTAVQVFVLWLDAVQLDRMHATEGNYTYDHLSEIRIELDDSHGTLTEAYAYSSKVGCFSHRGGHLSLAEIPADGRRFAEATQEQALGFLRDRIAPGVELDAFILEHIEDDDARAIRSRALGADALPLTFRRRTVDPL